MRVGARVSRVDCVGEEKATVPSFAIATIIAATLGSESQWRDLPNATSFFDADEGHNANSGARRLPALLDLPPTARRQRAIKEYLDSSWSPSHHGVFPRYV